MYLEDGIKDTEVKDVKMSHWIWSQETYKDICEY